MDARAIIDELCRRFGVSGGFGRRLLPLVERAVRSEPGKQRLILELVERSFAEEASRNSTRWNGVLTGEEWRCVRTVASLLHGWRPPAWLERWEDPPPARP